MKTMTWILGGMAVVAGVALLAWAFAPRPLEVETAVADRGPFETVITEEGRTTLRQRYTVSAPLSGRLARITLEAGDAVAAGSVLATLSPTLAPMLDARTQRELTARVAAAQANVQRAGSQAEAARVALVQTRSAQQRSAELARQGFVSPIQAENDALAVDAAQKALDAAQQGRVVAGHELEVARAALAAVATTTDASTARGFDVRAPVAGRVLRVLQASEGTVALGTPLLELGDLNQLEVVAELLTTDALQAGAGRPVRIEDWGGPGTLQGRVRLVEPAGFTKVSALGVEEQRVRVHIDLTSPPAAWQTLGDGFRVTVRIVTQQVDDALRVPVSAVFPRPEGGHAVFVVDAGRARLQPVDLAARNETHAWLRGGVDAGGTVVVYPPAALTEGARLRVRGS
ncbi:efflux RND transporter periplasmic adaptor subunit [Rubrivivax albus]|uniref:HlyD family efflux transporter periplasmic adaptor subunit n=1 Tax=Rubrivivax albus TaxID=2499835 RepID=A0A437K005_9BURK|nr:HlyD family efflux transporter periplasmic adaptor subunit [Rubrivivax albus]RVT53708.1 HlyD family efflux transporter periplasmic adaptor subunit [Rubrivivax albus]